jgi:hypothetical protein
MPARYLLAALALVFLTAGVLGATADRPRPQTRTWLLVGTIFAIVSFWLFVQG